jgi:O-antigen ligase
MFKWFYLLGTLTLSLNFVRPFGVDLALSDFFYFIALGCLIFEGIASKRPLREWLPPHSFWLPASLILAGGLIATINAVEPASSIFETLKIWFLFSLWISMGIVMVRNKGQAGNVIIAFILSALFTSVVAIGGFLTGADIGSIFTPNVSSYYSGRYGGTLGHPNHLGAIVALCMPLVIVIRWSRWNLKSGKLKALGLCAACFLLGWAAMLAGSVAGFIAIILSVSLILLVGLWRLLRRGRLLLLLSALIVASGGGIIATYFVASVSLEAKMSDLAFSDHFERVRNTTGRGRVELLEESWRLIQDNPLFGSGMDQIKRQDPTAVTTMVVHNALALGWQAGGLLTFVGLILIYWLTLKMIFRSALAIIKGHSGWLALGLAGSSLGWIFISMNNPVVYSRYGWISVSLLLGMSQSKYAYFKRPAKGYNSAPEPALTALSIASHR